MLCTTVMESGGLVCTDFDDIDGILLEEDNSTKESTKKDSKKEQQQRAIRAVGVMVSAIGQHNSANTSTRTGVTGGKVEIGVLRARRSVVSGLGVKATYQRVFLDKNNLQNDGAATATTLTGNEGTISAAVFLNVVPTVVEKALAALPAPPSKLCCVLWVSPDCFQERTSSSSADMTRDMLQCNYYESTQCHDSCSISGSRVLHERGRCKIWCPSARDRFAYYKLCCIITFI